ncbi:MAG: phosphohydrolase, partial [Candidatus Thermofonsia Clade 3 bacterium]
VFIRLQPIQEGSQTLWNHVEAMLNNAVEQGLIRKVA